MSVTIPLADIGFADNSHGTVTLTLSSENGVLQSVNYFVPDGHFLTFVLTAPDVGTVYSETVQGDSTLHTISVPGGFSMSKLDKYQISVYGG